MALLPNLTPIPDLGPGANPATYPIGSVSPNLSLPLAPMPRSVSDAMVVIDAQLALLNLAVSNALTPGSLANYALVKTQEINISSAQLKVLATTPAALLVPGIPGTWLQLISCAIELVAGTVPYSVGFGNLLQVQLGNSFTSPNDQPFQNLPMTGFLDQTVSTVVGLINDTVIDTIVSSEVAGQGIYLTASANPTSGNGTLKITVSYNSFVL